MNHKKRILFIAPSPLYLEKGSSLRMYSMAHNLSKKYKIDIVTYSTGKEFSINNSKVHRTPNFFKPKLKIGKPTFSKIFLDLFLLMNSLFLISKNKYDIIHCEDFEGACVGLIVSFFGKKKKLVYDLHNKLSDNLDASFKKYPRRILKKLENYLLKKFDLVIVNWAKYLTDPSLENINKFLYYDKINLKVKKSKLPALPKQYLVYSGNFEPYQGLEEFLSIFKKIKETYKIVLIGEPEQRILDFVKNNNLSNRVIFMGRLPIEKSNFIIKNAKFGILSRLKGSSMKSVHYLVMSVPVIAKDTESNKELIVEGKNGYLYNRFNMPLVLKKISKEIDPYTLNGVLKSKHYIQNIWRFDNFLRNYEKNVLT